MFELLEVKDNAFLKNGDVLEIRTGKSVNFIVTVEKISKTASEVKFWCNKKVITSGKYLTSVLTSYRLRTEFPEHCFGRALYRKVEKEVVGDNLQKGQKYQAMTVCDGFVSDVILTVHDRIQGTSQDCYHVCIKNKTTGLFEYIRVNKISLIPGIVKRTIKLLCPNGVEAIPEEEPEDRADYIIWCPSSNRPPRVVLKGRAQAKKVAIEMSERHKSTFHWCKLEGKVQQVAKVVTKITEAE